MANRYFTSQFSYSNERMLVNLLGSITQSGSTGTFAAATASGVTVTAKVMGSDANSYTFALVAGATAGAEVASISGRAIQVTIQSGVSTQTQVSTAISAAAAVLAIVTPSVASGGSAVTAVSAVAFTGGADTVFTKVGLGKTTMTQTGTGIYQIALADPYTALLACGITPIAPAAANLMGQVSSMDTTSASQKIIIRVVAGATPTNLATTQGLLIDIKLRNSSQGITGGGGI